MSKKVFSDARKEINPPEIEREILEFWEKKGIFRKCLEQTKESKPYVFYDGPPFATGLPHYGHLLAGTLKDIVPRYWTMKDRYVERRFGWDCHGLPVENEMEKEFKVSGKKDIESLGIHIFNEACRSIVLRYTSEWRKIVERIGRWVDFENQYRTMDPEFMESIWWVFKQVWDKELIYEGFRVQPYCPRCATPLSNFELNQGYMDKKTPSITLTFPIDGDENTKLLAWTTTPWTLPSNVLLAAGEDVEYVKVKDQDNYFILAKDRLSAYYKDDSEYTVVEEMTGKDLCGLRYKPVFDYFKDRSSDFFRVVNADFVSTEDGTGIVHIAPAFGEDDFETGKKEGLPLVCPVDSSGRFTDEVPELKGKLVFDADPEVISMLKEKKRLIHKTTINHRYPHCYRCDTPLIYKAMDTWFMRIDTLKENMKENNSRIHWVPSHLREGRFGRGIEGAPDWNISRNRYWGTPIPVWKCGDCGKSECVGSLKDLHLLIGNGEEDEGFKRHTQAVKEVNSIINESAAESLSDFGIDSSWAEKIKENRVAENDIHSHIIDRIEIRCPECGSSAMKRTPEVLDCWFESGSMPYAQNHYPFESPREFEENFPADFIAEGIDQTRGWFYTLTVLSSALFQKEAFRNVVVNGIILAEDGQKLSKRLRNYTPPQEILERLGADALRIFLINSPAVKAEDLKFSDEGVKEMSRSVLLPLWNAYTFFVTYANVDSWSPDYTGRPQPGNELDRWLISLLNHVVKAVNQEMAEYRLFKVVPLLVDYIENLTNWYIRRSRRRFWKSENDSDKDDAYSTLHYVLVEFSKLTAPFLPFLTEAVYRDLVSGVDKEAPESVHLCGYPEADDEAIDSELEERMETVRSVVKTGRLLRSRYNIKNRQPLSSITVIINDEKRRNMVEAMSGLIREELNVHDVYMKSDEYSVVDISAKPNYRNLGRVYGKKMKEAAEIISGFSLDEIERIKGGGERQVLGHTLAPEDIVLNRDVKEGVEVETDGDITVALNTEITQELKLEGFAREFVNRVQNIRKDQGFDVTDRIRIDVNCPDEIAESLDRLKDYISNEVLAVSINLSYNSVKGTETDINGERAEISVHRED